MLPLLITILTLPLLTTPASKFATYQFALWPTNPTPHSASNSTMSFPTTYPVVYDATFERFIFLAGFHFNIANTMAYRVNVSMGLGSTDGIYLTVENDLVVYYITFWVGVVRRNPMVYMQNIEYYPQNLSRWNFTGIFQYFSVPHTFQFTQLPNIQAYILFKSADIQSLPNNRLDIGAFISGKSRIDVSITLARYVVAPVRVIRRVEYVLVMFNVYKIVNQNGGYHYQEILLHYNTTGLHPYLNNTAANFGIPDSFRSQNGYSGNCMLGMVGFRFVDVETTYVLMNLSYYPVNHQMDIHSSRPLDTLITIYKLICVMEEFYQDEECITRTRFGFEYCQQCTTERCVTCQKGFVLLNEKCVCIVGKMVNGVCIQTPGCVDIVKTIDGEEICMACDGNYFHTQPVNGSCSCLDGYTQVNGICSPSNRLHSAADRR